MRLYIMRTAFQSFQAAANLSTQYNACELQAVLDTWEWWHNTAHSTELLEAADGELERVHNLEVFEAFQSSFDSEGIEGFSEVAFDPATGREVSVDDLLELIELIEAGY